MRAQATHSTTGPRNAVPGGGAVVTTLGGIEVLFVCTGNICRSPMAEAFAKERLAARGFAVSSAGTRATLGTCTPDVLDVMGSYELDVAPHRSRQLTPELLDDAALPANDQMESLR